MIKRIKHFILVWKETNKNIKNEALIDMEFRAFEELRLNRATNTNGPPYLEASTGLGVYEDIHNKWFDDHMEANKNPNEIQRAKDLAEMSDTYNEMLRQRHNKLMGESAYT